MADYSIITLTHQNGTITTALKRNSDNAFIPVDTANTDYQEYIEWTKLSPANVAAPADE